MPMTPGVTLKTRQPTNSTTLHLHNPLKLSSLFSCHSTTSPILTALLHHHITNIIKNKWRQYHSHHYTLIIFTPFIITYHHCLHHHLHQTPTHTPSPLSSYHHHHCRVILSIHIHNPFFSLLLIGVGPPQHIHRTPPKLPTPPLWTAAIKSRDQKLTRLF